MRPLVALAVSAHPGEAHAADVAGLSPAALLPVVLAVIGGLYIAGLVRRAHETPARRPLLGLSSSSWPAVSFGLGWFTLAAALVGPIDEGAERLLWVHMTQHELLMLLAAPLLVLGRPLVVWLWALPLGWRRGLVRSSRVSGLSRGWFVVTTPVVAWALHALALWSWHLPSAYQAAIGDEWVHLLQHTCFLGSAIVFWWSLVHGRHGRLGYGAGVLYVFSTGVHSSVLGALMTFSNRTWYPVYDSRALSQGWVPIVDQQLAGLLMWVPAGLVFIVVGLALFAAWLGEAERRVALGQADTLAHSLPPRRSLVLGPSMDGGEE